MTVRKYISTSQETTLTVALTSNATTMTVISAAGLLGTLTPAVGETFTVVIDPDTSQEEIVDVISPSAPGSNTLTITRGVGVDGTTAIAHSVGAKVRHMATGRDFREANLHIENSTTAHGLTIANVLETTDTNMITNAMLQSNSVTTAKITDLNVTTGKIADSAITSAKIADLTIVTGDIADSAITSAKIADLTIATGDIADSAITSAKIADGTIVAGDIADGAVTSAKILNDTIVNADINTSAQIAYGKLSLTNTILNADINASAAIDKTKISGTAITAADTGTVTSTMIADGAITNADINAAAAIALSKLATDPLARANHTGTQTASTVSDFDTQVRTSRLDQMAAPTGSVSANSQKITNLATPTSNTDAATKAYADLMIPLTQKGAASGVAELDADGLLPANRLPALSITTTQVVATQAAMLALTAQTGDVAVRTDLNKTFILTASPATTLANWQELLTPTDAVLSVDGQTGTVSLSSTYATVANAANKLPLAGGTMSGAIAMGSNKITGLGTPTTTGDAATKDYADTKLALTGGTLSGALAMGTNKITGVGDPTNAQDAATKNYIDNTVLAPSNLIGVITSVGNATSIASQTGTGSKFVVDTSPTLVTPVLGAATATSINGTTIPASKTLVATDSTVYVVPPQTGNSGKFLTTDGTASSWGTVAGYLAPTLGSTSIASGATVTNVNGLTINSTTIPTSKTLVTTDTTAYVSTAGGSTVTASGATVIPVVLKGATSQTADLLSFQNSSGTVLSEFDASGNLGIGTTALTTAGGYASITLNGTSGSLWSAKVAGTETFRIQPTAASTTINGIANIPILFNTNNTERMRLDSAGRLLIGTGSASGANLEVVNASGDAIIVTRPSASTASTTMEAQSNDFYSTPSYRSTAITQYSGSATGTTIGLSNASLGLLKFQNTSAGLIYTNGANPIVFATSATERMRIDSAGSVGIGVTPSGAMLHVVNNTAGNIGTVLKGAASQTGDLLQIQNSSGTVLIKVNSAGQPHLGGYGTLSAITGNSTSYLTHQYHDVTGADSWSLANNYLRTNTSTGTVPGSTIGSAEIQLLTSGAGSYTSAITFATSASINTAPTQRMIIDKSGNVGINSDASGARLDIVGVSGGTVLRLTDNVNSTLSIKTQSPGNLLTYETGGTASQRWVVNGSERLRLESDGTLLLGNAAPLSGGALKRGLSIKSGTSGYGGIYILSGNDSAGDSATVEAIGRRSDGNGSRTFSGTIALGHLRTDAASGNGMVLGNIVFGGNPSGTAESNVIYAASIYGVADGTWSSTSAMPTGLVFLTGSTGTALPTPNADTGLERLRIASEGATTVTYTTTTGKAVRNTYMSTSAPSGGADGDVWIQYV
jgi:hypothetical protein